MRGYGQFCPVAKGAEVFAERWTPLVLRELLCGSTHFNDLHRGVPLMSRTLLSQRLKQLEEIGVVTRKSGPKGPEHHLTEAGKEFAPIVARLGEWGQRWFRSKFSGDELDVKSLVWDMRRTVRPDAFPPGRISVQFDFSDLPMSKRTWWLLCDHGEVGICPTDPGFEANLFVATDLRTMTRVWMGDISVRVALRSGGIGLEGSREFRERFERWLGLSGFARNTGCEASGSGPSACGTLMGTHFRLIGATCPRCTATSPEAESNANVRVGVKVRIPGA